MKAPNGLWCLAISVFFCSFIGGVRNQQSCPPPDVPTEGKYLPQQKKFLPGDKVAYACKDGFTLMGKGDRTCKSNGAWSDSTPFCDRPVKLKNPRRMNNGGRTLSYVIDDKTNTCFPWENSTGDIIQVYLDEPAVVHAVRIFLDPGAIKIQIFSNRENKVYASFDRYIERSQWVLIKFENSDTLSDFIKIKNIADKGGFTICEIEVYVKDEFGCEYPPDIRIAHGFFEVSRNKATLQCEEGFTAAHKRLVCEGNMWKGQEPACNENLCEPLVYNSTLDPGTEWIFLDSVRKLSPGTRRQLKCESGYQKVGGPERVICQKNGLWSKTNATCKAEPPKTSTRTIIMIAVGTVVVLIVLLLLAVTIYLIKKQRSREVVVVFKPTGEGSLPPGSESEYATVYYETIQGGVPVPPTTQRPSPLPPVLNDGYILPEDCKRTLKKQNPMPADIAFGTLKPSVLYSN